MAPRRSGFTLVETIVAILILEVGVLAVVATAGVAARDLAEAAARRRVSEAARNRVESLLVSACAGASGSALLAGVTESWRVEQHGAGRVVIAAATIPLSHGRRATAEARSWTACSP